MSVACKIMEYVVYAHITFFDANSFFTNLGVDYGRDCLAKYCQTFFLITYSQVVITYKLA